MMTLIVLLIGGSLLAYVSQHNLALVSLNLGPYTISSVPLFYVIVGSLVIGLLFSHIVYVFHDISNFFQLRKKDKKIKSGKESVLELTKRVHQLELENEKLKNRSQVNRTDPNSL